MDRNLVGVLFLLVVVERGMRWGGAHSVDMNWEWKGRELSVTVLRFCEQVWRDTSRGHVDSGPGKKVSEQG